MPKLLKKKKINCTKKILSGHSFSQKCERQFHNTLHICDFRGSGDFRGFMTILVLANLWKLCTRPAPSLHYSINSVPAPPRPPTGREILSPPRPRNSGESRDKPQNSPRPICSPPPRPVPEFRGGGRGSPGIEASITHLSAYDISSVCQGYIKCIASCLIMFSNFIIFQQIFRNEKWWSTFII